MCFGAEQKVGSPPLFTWFIPEKTSLYTHALEEIIKNGSALLYLYRRCRGKGGHRRRTELSRWSCKPCSLQIRTDSFRCDTRADRGDFTWQGVDGKLPFCRPIVVVATIVFQGKKAARCRFCLVKTTAQTPVTCFFFVCGGSFT